MVECLIESILCVLFQIFLKGLRKTFLRLTIHLASVNLDALTMELWPTRGCCCISFMCFSAVSENTRPFFFCNLHVFLSGWFLLVLCSTPVLENVQLEFIWAEIAHWLKALFWLMNCIKQCNSWARVINLPSYVVKFH